MGRHWPDARGIFVNNAKNFLVWVNEEDLLDEEAEEHEVK